MIEKANPRDPLNQALSLINSALKVHKKTFSIAAENIANADTVAKPGEKPYQKKVVVALETISPQTGHLVQRAKVQEVESFGQRIYDPDHPYADAQGYKTISDVNTTQEMVNASNAKKNIDYMSRLHEMAHGLKKQDISLLTEK